MKLEILGLRKDKVNQLNAKGIKTVQDLIDFIPRKYHDFTKSKVIKDLIDGEYECVIGEITEITENNTLLKISLKDEMNWKMGVSFFHRNYLKKSFKVGDKIIAGGKVKLLKECGNYRTMTNPEVFSKNIKDNLKIMPVYSAIKGMTPEFLEKTIISAINSIEKDDYLENILLAKYNLLPKYKASSKLHLPKTIEDVEDAKKRLLFDDLFNFNFNLMSNRETINRKTDIEIKNFIKAKELMDNLPFELTKSQREVLRNLSTKMMKKQRLNGLVQGDVGSGKTLVAILLMVTVSENGYQSCLVAPTNILAKQHYIELKERVEPLGFKVGFISSELKAKETKAVLKDLEEGKIDMIVGTHSLMGNKVKFENLGISIIDEEHRFGVEQREKLNLEGVHTVTMSATPIPRSLALSLYGDTVDVETITALPAGRKEIVTEIISNLDKKKSYEKILNEIKSGRQAYIVCPLISKSESEKLEGITNIDNEYKVAKAYFEKHGFKVGVVTGKMKEDEVSEQLFKFKNKEFHVLVSTTIIEVGVNIPNATVIVINNAERFGFAQLHQLRGRVGRGSFESYCYLITEKNEKFNIFTKTKDGFKIAKEDLLLRGAGDFLGTAQSGGNKYLMLMLGNPELNESIKKDIDEIFKEEKRFNRYDLFLRRDDDECDASKESSKSKKTKKP